jgi:hypothetical protein
MKSELLFEGVGGQTNRPLPRIRFAANTSSERNTIDVLLFL